MKPVLYPLLFSLSWLLQLSALGQETNDTDTLKQYVAELQQSPDNEVLREKIVKLAATMDPPPEIPQEAKDHAARAGQMAKMALTQSDYADAAKELDEAIEIAPWSGSLYYYRGKIEELADDPKEAISAYNLYLLASPQADNASVVRSKIAALEAQLEETQKRKEFIRFLNGTWESQNPIRINDRDGSSDGFKLDVNVSDDGSVEATLYPNPDSSYKFKGSVKSTSATLYLSDVGSQGTDTGSVTLIKKGSILDANLNFTVNGSTTYSYSDFLNR